MTIEDDYRAVVARLRGWGVAVTEWSGCYGRNNGTGWSHGRPVGHINHHYVCSMNPEQSYIDSLVGSLAGNETVQWFADVNGRAYLIGTGPMNHSGTGNSYVLNRTMQDQPNYGAASSQGDMSGNQTYAGTECQHPGDGTAWPESLLETMFAINAAEFLQWGYTAERAINHSSWTNRKIDMSWMGGTNGQELVEQVQRWMTTGGAGGQGDDDVTDEDIQKIAKQVWNYMVGNGGAGATLEEVRKVNRDINAKVSKLCDPRNGNVPYTG